MHPQTIKHKIFAASYGAHAGMASLAIQLNIPVGMRKRVTILH